MQLVPPVLGDVYQLASRIDGKAFAIANSGGVTISRGKGLVGFIGVEAPGATAGFEFRARVSAGGFEGSVFQLAGVGRGSHIDIHGAVGVMANGCMG